MCLDGSLHLPAQNLVVDRRQGAAFDLRPYFGLPKVACSDLVHFSTNKRLILERPIWSPKFGRPLVWQGSLPVASKRIL
jgi:hypothetical protein